MVQISSGLQTPHPSGDRSSDKEVVKSRNVTFCEVKEEEMEMDSLECDLATTHQPSVLPFSTVIHIQLIDVPSLPLLGLL